MPILKHVFSSVRPDDGPHRKVHMQIVLFGLDDDVADRGRPLPSDGQAPIGHPTRRWDGPIRRGGPMRVFQSVLRLVEHNYELLCDEVGGEGRSSRALVLLVFAVCPVVAGILYWMLEQDPGGFTHEFALAVAVLTGFALLSAVCLYSLPASRTGRLDEVETTRLHAALAYLVLVGVGYLSVSFFEFTFMGSSSLYHSSALFRAAVDLELVTLVSHVMLVHYLLFALVVVGRLYRATVDDAERSTTSEVDR